MKRAQQLATLDIRFASNVMDAQSKKIACTTVARRTRTSQDPRSDIVKHDVSIIGLRGLQIFGVPHRRACPQGGVRLK